MNLKARTVGQLDRAVALISGKLPELQPEVLDGNKLVLSFILLGVVLRALVYIYNPPFWTDEAQLALNIRTHSLVELLGRLDYCQAAPPGFLVLEKALVSQFGESDFVLRLLPFLAGLGSLLLFVELAKRHVTSFPLAFSVLLFALSEPLIRYSVEFKSYSIDVFCALLIWTLVGSTTTIPTGAPRTVTIFLVGIASPWFSYASVLAILAYLIVGLTSSLARQRRSELARWTCFSSAVALSIGLLYVSSLRDVDCGACKSALMDTRAVPPHTFEAANWIGQKILEVMQFPGGFSSLSACFAIVCLVIGMWHLSQHQPFMTAILSLPFGLALVGAWFSLYPFFGRFLLFAAPAIILFVAQGAAWMHQSLKHRLAWLPAALVLLLLIPRCQFIYWTGSQFGLRHTDIRSVLRYVQVHREPGDVIYCYYGAYFPVAYYCDSENIRLQDIVVGVPGYWWNTELRRTLLDAWQKSLGTKTRPIDAVFESYKNGDFSPQWSVFEADIARLAGQRRVWAIFSLTNWLGSDEERLFLHFLDKRGRRLSVFKAPGASVYQYDLSNSDAAPANAHMR